jgi:hypothetical protein
MARRLDEDIVSNGVRKWHEQEVETVYVRRGRSIEVPRRDFSDWRKQSQVV